MKIYIVRNNVNSNVKACATKEMAEAIAEGMERGLGMAGYNFPSAYITELEVIEEF